MYADPLETILYNEIESERRYCRFYHSSTEKVLALIKRAKTEENDSVIRNALDKTTSIRDICQKHGQKTHRFCFPILNSNILSNKTVEMDLMKLGNQPVLHVRDRNTKPSVAALTQGEFAKAM